MYKVLRRRSEKEEVTKMIMKVKKERKKERKDNAYLFIYL